MANYSKNKTETLRRLSEIAFSEYYAEAIKPIGNWSKHMSFSALERARKRLDAINAELERRITIQNTI